MKKLSIVLALMLAMTAFTGCEKEDDKGSKKEETKTEQKQDTKKKDKKKDKEKEVAPEEIVEAFLDDAFSQNLGDFEDYFAEDSDEEDSFNEFKNLEFAGDGVDVIIETFGEELGDEMISAVYDSFEYEVVDVKEDGDTAEVTVSLKSPDFQNMEFDEEELLIEVMGIDPSTATEDDILEWMEENGLDENSTEEDMMEVFGPAFVDYMVEVMADADKTEDESVFTVVKTDDDKWEILSIE